MAAIEGVPEPTIAVADEAELRRAAAGALAAASEAMTGATLPAAAAEAAAAEETSSTAATATATITIDDGREKQKKPFRGRDMNPLVRRVLSSGKTAGAVLLGGLGVATLFSSVYTVEGGHSAVVFNR